MARVRDDAAYARIGEVARAGGVLYLKVEPSPVGRVAHAVTVHGPRPDEMLRLFGEVLGPATEAGTPLRLGLTAGRSGTQHRATHAYGGGSAPSPASPASPVVSGEALIGRALSAGKLVIHERVGEGGVGTVYRAWHRDLKMSVAVKVMHGEYQRDPKYSERFQAEALAASRLDHTNLTRVLDFGQEPDGLLYLAMEFLDGKSLRDELVDGGPMTFERAAHLIAQVCSGLTHAHARSIVHRDIKPENIVLVSGLDDDGRETQIAKVCDFGIAHRTTDAEAVFAGTAEYMSPEQLAGDEPDVQSDVYACGVVLYELLTGEVPIAGDFPGIARLVREVIPEPPSRRLAGLDPRIDRLVLKALSKDRGTRHATIRELRQELRAVAEDIAVFTTGGGYYDAPASIGPASRPRLPSLSDATPDWLEHGSGVLASLVPPSSASVPIASASSPPSSRRSSSLQPAVRSPLPSRPSYSSVEMAAVSVLPSAVPEESETARNVAAFVEKLVHTTDAERFGALVGPIEPKIRALFEQGHVGPAWRLCSALDMIAAENNGRGAHAQRAVAVFAAREILAPLAEKALDFLEDKEGTARKLVVRSGNRAAHALYTARLKHSVFEARERFVAMMLEIGAAGLPTMRAGLDRLEPKLAVPGALGIAEDLLRAVPEIADAELGGIVARYLKTNVNSLVLLATNALPKTVGVRARGLLVPLVHHRNDDVAVAAIKNLRALGGVDRELLEQLRPLVTGAPGARQAVRLAAVESFESASREALPAARELLVAALDATHGTTPDVEDMIVVLANTIVSVGGDVTVVATRWRRSNTWLRTRLEAVLRRADLPPSR